MEKKRKRFTWESVETLPAPEFFEALQSHFKKITGRNLDYAELSRMSMWSVSSLKKWLCSESYENNPIETPVRRHLFIEAVHCIAVNRTRLTEHTGNPVSSRKRYVYHGELLSSRAIAGITDQSLQMVYYRLRKGNGGRSPESGTDVTAMIDGDAK